MCLEENRFLKSLVYKVHVYTRRVLMISFDLGSGEEEGEYLLR